MKHYFDLQNVMINRKMRDAGINPVLTYLLGFVAFTLLSEYLFFKTDFAKYLVIILCLSLQLKLSLKNRTDFILSTFGDKNKKRIRILENLIVSVPFVALLLYKNHFVEVSVLFIFSILLSMISFHNNLSFSFPTPFSKKPFEFSTGFRKTFLIFPIAYGLIITSIYVDNLNLGIVSLLFIFITALGYYTKPEQDYFVWVHAETPNSFLRNKVLIGTKNIALLTTPAFISLSIFNPSEFDLILLFFIIGHLFLWTIILAKYAAFPKEIGLPEGIIIGIILPLPPLLLIAIPYFYIKSINNLKTFLDD